MLPQARARDIARLRGFAKHTLDLAQRSAAHADLGVGVIPQPNAGRAASRGAPRPHKTSLLTASTRIVIGIAIPERCVEMTRSPGRHTLRRVFCA